MDFVVRTIVGDLPSVVLSSSSKATRTSIQILVAAVKKIDQCRHDEDDLLIEEPQQEHICLVEFKKEKKIIQKRRSLATGMFSFSNHRDSVLVYKNKNKNKTSDNNKNNDDDETASTVDMYDDEDSSLFSLFSTSSSSSLCSEESSSSSSLSLKKSVSFPEDDHELVTAVYTRPRTTTADKYYLHYDEYDYMDFKLEYRDELYQQHYGCHSEKQLQQLRRPYYRKSGSRKVGFKLDVVESVHPVMDLSARKEIQNDLFYTANEMRQFLDDFVASLQQQTTTTKPTTIVPEDDDDTEYQQEQQQRIQATST